MNISRRAKSRILLLVVTIVSLMSSLYYTTRYVEFFNALAGFGLEIDKIDFLTTQDDLNVTMELEIRNPTGYGDLLLNGMSGTVNYEGEIHKIVISPGGPRSGAPYQEVETNLWQLPDGYVSPIQPIRIQSYSTDRFTMSIIARSETAKTFNDYYQKTTGQLEIRWHINLRVSITTPTFLGIMELQYDLIH